MSNLSRRILTVEPSSEAEEARIQKLIASDPDAPEATDEQLASAKPFVEAFPQLDASIQRTKRQPRKAAKKARKPRKARRKSPAPKAPRPRGRPKLAKALTHISLRLDPDALEAFRSTGDGWQGRINEAIKAAAKKLRRA